jgi:hypothetical protein
MSSTDQGPAARTSALRRWVQRVGVLGFLFFLIKGLLWLVVPFLIALCASERP